MESKNTDMQDIFNKLNEKNRETVLLIAKSMKIAQEVAERECKHPKQTA